MAHRYDVSLKALFLREGDGIIRRLLFGGSVTEHLATEQPQVFNHRVFNHRADMVVRTEDGSLRQVEFQTSDEAGFALRMLAHFPSNPTGCGSRRLGPARPRLRAVVTQVGHGRTGGVAVSPAP